MLHIERAEPKHCLKRNAFKSKLQELVNDAKITDFHIKLHIDKTVGGTK